MRRRRLIKYFCFVNSCVVILLLGTALPLLIAHHWPLKQFESRYEYLEDTLIEDVSSKTRLWYNYTRVGNRQLFIFSAIAEKKSVQNQSWDFIAVTGWELLKAKNATYSCCLFYDDGSVTVSNSSRKRRFFMSGHITAKQVMCHYPQAKTPRSIGLALLTENCPTAERRIAIIHPNPEKRGIFAVCGKIIYGKKNPLELIEWIEYQQHFGADKIILYPYQDLNGDALKVLQYYVMNDVIEIVPMPFVPELGRWKRHFSRTGSGEMFNDEQVSMLDAQVRLRQYQYLAIVDTDEFIAPSPKSDVAKSYSDLMDNLTSTHPKASSFTMRVHFHSLNYNKTDLDLDLKIAQYRNRSQAIYDRPKNIHIPGRVRPGSIWIHYGTALPGYKGIVAKEHEVVLKHFRLCTKGWLKPSTKYKPNHCFGFRIRHDNYMQPIAEAIAPNVRRTRKLLGL